MKEMRTLNIRGTLNIIIEYIKSLKHYTTGLRI